MKLQTEKAIWIRKGSPARNSGLTLKGGNHYGTLKSFWMEQKNGSISGGCVRNGVRSGRQARREARSLWNGLRSRRQARSLWNGVRSGR